MPKIQFNCRLDEQIANYIADEAARKGCSQAALITMWANRASVGLSANSKASRPTKRILKLSKGAKK